MPIDTRSPEYRGALNCVRSNSILGIVAQRVDELEAAAALALKMEARLTFLEDLRDAQDEAVTRSTEAIAALRSANAELLEALEGLVADWERCHGRIPDDHDARVAIAKAKSAAAAARGMES